MVVSYVDATAGAVEHCEAMARDFPDLASTYGKIAEYCQQKLWHPLTLTILDFCSQPSNVRTLNNGGQHSFLALYNHIVSAVDSKLNPLSLARIAALIAQVLAPHDMTAAKAMLENLLQKEKEQQQSASSVSPAMVYLESKLSLLTLQPYLQTDAGATEQDPDKKKEQLQAVKAVMTKNAMKINAHLLEESSRNLSEQCIVQAAHYEQSMTYYKVVGPPEAFYEQAMSFLNYAPVPTTPEGSTLSASSVSSFTDYRQLAVDLCLAALTGDGVYNLGQVEQTPLLTLLQQTEHAWLVELLQACASGNVVLFGELTKRHEAVIAKQPALVHRANAVQEKLTLLALVHLVLEKSSHERTIPFAEIATRLHIPETQVEWVVMRALSVGLVEGSMDQVDQTVQVTWVLPRVLNEKQMRDLATRFGEWAVKVSQTKDYMQEQTPTFA